ncbi:glycosyltransferase family 2 protein [Candidatus Oscillochloris fontis]|uniref:glycosyltransferase family 2 protein n=1 Tax=Candidatus Oscillochloris fontis TaxID=2496868 RepID=UPI001581C4FD|nr:glycosyltransferase family 2 protein [Candidatus Oscillochloris fontis]
MTRPPISAVIPTWNGLRYLPACLMALRAQLGPQDEIVLVDNASRDGAGAWARRYAPDVRVVALPTNLGFAGGTNAGIRAARGELLLLINDDALAEPGCVAALWAALRESPSAGAAAGALVFSRRPDRVASAGIRFQADGVATDMHIGLPVAELPQEPQPIFGASGGLALLRRRMLDDVGLFAEEFFSYLEDVDLAWRARLRGWDAVLAGGARARHVYSATGGQGSPFKQALLGRNRVRVLVRVLPTPILRDLLPAILRYDLLAVGYALLRGQAAMVRGRVAGLREMPRLLAQRRVIQAGRSVPVGELVRWIEPAPSPVEALRLQRRLQALLA